MTLTLLLDLDDTLLQTNLNVFVPAYFQALGHHLSNRVAPEATVRALMSGLTIMYAHEDPAQTLMNAFDAGFYPKLGIPKDELNNVLDDFYDNIFPTLRSHTQPIEEAAALIDWALACGYRVAITTDPVFPRKATFHRLRWAGVDPERVELISTYEHFHFTKSFPAYYAEVLGRLGWPEGPSLVVGDNIERDLAPANRLGLATYLIDGESGSGPGFEAGRGKLPDLRPWLESINWTALEPSYTSRDAILAILLSTPAVLHGLSSSLTEEEWRREPRHDAWAMNEVVCHLRDTEREIHQLQLNLLLERDGAFIPRPDTGIWANERQYLNVNGVEALAEFTSARMKIVETLRAGNDELWSRRARHAIFGPTDFLEVIRFIADHDRLHIQQAWNTLQSI